MVGLFDGYFESAGPHGGKARHQIPGIRLRPARIGLSPRFERLERLFQISSELCFVGGGDKILLLVTGAFAQLIGSLIAFRGECGLSQKAIREPQCRVGCGVVRDVPLAEVDRLVVGKGSDGRAAGDPAATVAAAEFVVVEMACQSRVTPEIMAPFVQAPDWGPLRLWVRRSLQPMN